MSTIVSHPQFDIERSENRWRWIKRRRLARSYRESKALFEQMAARAQEIGLAYIAITDHSKRVSVARGLDEAHTLAQWHRIDACLEQADWVTARVQFCTRQSREQITARILGAIRHPRVHSISHPTGRLISRRRRHRSGRGLRSLEQMAFDQIR